jgi:hypothetical protein
VVSFPQVSSPKPSIRLSSPPYYCILDSELRADRCRCLENRKASVRWWLLSVGSDCAVLVPPKVSQLEGVIIRVILSGTVSNLGATTSNPA